MKPFDIFIRAGFVSVYRRFLPVFLAGHADIGVLAAFGLHISGQEPDIFLSQKFPRRHQRYRACVSRIDKMGDMPVIRPFAAFLREVGAGAFGAEYGRLLADVVAGLGDSFCAAVPVDDSDKLRMAVAAAVGDVKFVARLLIGSPGPPDFRWLNFHRRRGHNHHNEHRCPEDEQAADYQAWPVSFSLVSPPAATAQTARRVLWS